MGAQSNDTLATESAAEWVPIGAVKPWPGNPRKNDGEAIRRVAESIKRFGFAAPIVARKADGEIIAGHTRWKAARELKLDRVPVRFVDLDPADAHLLALADNRYTELTEWDKPALGSALSEFGLENAAFVGWAGDDLSKLGDGFIDGVSAPDGDPFASLMNGEPEVATRTFHIPRESVDMVDEVLSSAGDGTQGEQLVMLCEAFSGRR